MNQSLLKLFSMQNHFSYSQCLVMNWSLGDLKRVEDVSTESCIIP
jgi:hypothetical protein